MCRLRLVTRKFSDGEATLGKFDNITDLSKITGFIGTDWKQLLQVLPIVLQACGDIFGSQLALVSQLCHGARANHCMPFILPLLTPSQTSLLLFAVLPTSSSWSYSNHCHLEGWRPFPGQRAHRRGSQGSGGVASTVTLCRR